MPFSCVPFYPPAVPRLEPIERTAEIIPAMMRRLERLETRLKLIEEEQKGGIDLTKFYGDKRGPINP